MSSYNYLDKTGLGLLWSKIKGLITQSDWNENDDTSAAYVQNRPISYYVDESYPIFVLDNYEFAFTSIGEAIDTGLTITDSIPVGYNASIELSWSGSGESGVTQGNLDIEDDGNIYIIYKDSVSGLYVYINKTNGKISIVNNTSIPLFSGTVTLTIPYMEYSHDVNYDALLQPDWNQEYMDNLSYVRNRPAIRAGEGENSVMIGQIEQDEDARVYSISFDYPTTATDTITFTTSDDLSDIANLSATNKRYLTCRLEYDYTANNTTLHSDLFYNIIDIDVANSTITLDSKLSYMNTYTYSSVTGEIYYKYKIAYENNSVAEGMETIAGKEASHAEGQGTKAIRKGSHAEGWLSSASGIYSHAEGNVTKAIGQASHSEGSGTVASGSISHAENFHTESSGMYSHSEGSYTIASGVASHSEGNGGEASGKFSHVEGGIGVFTVILTGEANALTYTVSNDVFLNGRDVNWIVNASVTANSGNNYALSSSIITEATIENDKIKSITLNKTLSASAISSKTYYIFIPNKVTGDCSHAEGAATVASGGTSHAEGLSTLASAKYSHAEGYQTVAASESQHVQGRSNIIDSSNTYADIVGNGTSSSRSNAYTLDWNGNGWYAGKVTVGAAPTNNMDVATKQYVDENGGITYTISINGSTITLTGSDSSTSSVSLPVYDGSVTDVNN